MKIGRRKLLITGLALGAALGALAVGIVVNASETTFESTTTTKSRYAKRLERQEHNHPHYRPGEKPCPHGSVESRTRPAQMIGPGSATTITINELYPVRSGWAAGACFGITWVWAGASGEDASTGRLVIARSGRWPHARVHLDIDVPGSGPLKITDAPLGPDVATSAQTAQLEFTGKRDITGTLDLSSDTVTLSTGQVIEPVAGRK